MKSKLGLLRSWEGTVSAQGRAPVRVVGFFERSRDGKTPRHLDHRGESLSRDGKIRDYPANRWVGRALVEPDQTPLDMPEEIGTLLFKCVLLHSHEQGKDTGIDIDVGWSGGPQGAGRKRTGGVSYEKIKTHIDSEGKVRLSFHFKRVRYDFCALWGTLEDPVSGRCVPTDDFDL
ncbi:MAG: hypothetical protein KAI66_21135 [Lentisphaeria bacterium]|nr:hypothetical protein [Lentisphaeria bacterium]